MGLFIDCFLWKISGQECNSCTFANIHSITWSPTWTHALQCLWSNISPEGCPWQQHLTNLTLQSTNWIFSDVSCLCGHSGCYHEKFYTTYWLWPCHAVPVVLVKSLWAVDTCKRQISRYGFRGHSTMIAVFGSACVEFPPPSPFLLLITLCQMCPSPSSLNQVGSVLMENLRLAMTNQKKSLMALVMCWCVPLGSSSLSLSGQHGFHLMAWHSMYERGPGWNSNLSIDICYQQLDASVEERLRITICLFRQWGKRCMLAWIDMSSSCCCPDAMLHASFGIVS